MAQALALGADDVFVLPMADAELQARTEAVVDRRLIAALEQLERRLPRRRIGISSDPPPHLVLRDAHPTSLRSSTNGRGPTCEITSDAATDPNRPHSASERPLVSPNRKPAA